MKGLVSFSQSPQSALRWATFLFGGDLSTWPPHGNGVPGCPSTPSQPWLPHARCWAHPPPRPGRRCSCVGGHTAAPGPPGPPWSALPPEGPRRSRHPAQVQRAACLRRPCRGVRGLPAPNPGDRGLSPVLKPTPLPTLQGWAQRAAALGASLRPGPGPPSPSGGARSPAGAQLLRHGPLGLQGRPRAHHRGQVSRRPRLPQHLVAWGWGWPCGGRPAGPGSDRRLAVRGATPHPLLPCQWEVPTQRRWPATLALPAVARGALPACARPRGHPSCVRPAREPFRCAPRPGELLPVCPGPGALPAAPGPEPFLRAPGPGEPFLCARPGGALPACALGPGSPSCVRPAARPCSGFPVWAAHAGL